MTKLSEQGWQDYWPIGIGKIKTSKSEPGKPREIFVVDAPFKEVLIKLKIRKRF